MIIETLTVTNTPTSILDLIIAVRGSYAGSTQQDAYQFKLPADAVSAVLAEDASTQNPIQLVSPGDQPYESNNAFDMREMFLSVESGTQDIEVIITRSRK